MALPGVNTIINDRFYSLSRTNIPLGVRVVIIGRRNDPATDATVTRKPGDTDAVGAINDLEPYNASNEKGVIERFGAMSDLHRGYLEAVSGGATRVTLIALPSDTAFDYDAGVITSANWSTLMGSAADPEGDGNGLFHAAFAEAESVNADIIVPWGSGGDPEFGGAATPATPYDDAGGVYGFYADNSASVDPLSSFAYKVAQKCAEITRDSHPCFAVMGVKPYDLPSNDDGSLLSSQVSAHVALPDLIDRELMDGYGIYLSVVATELVPLGYNRNYNMGYANGAATYAGAIAQLDAWSSPTSKVAFNIERIRYNPTKTQRQTMIDKGVVPVHTNFSRAPVWGDAQTFAKDGSDYRRLTTMRIVFDAVSMVRNVSQRFIGEATTLENRNSIETAIIGGLRSMQQLGALMSSDFAITYIPSENKAVVDLILQPAFELRNIEISVSVQL